METVIGLSVLVILSGLLIAAVVPVAMEVLHEQTSDPTEEA